MATYCIDLSASVNGSGTYASPFNAIPASASLADDDVLAFKRGTTGTIAFDAAEAASAYRYIGKNRITLRAYYNADSSDDTSQPKPVIYLQRLAAASTANYFIRFNAANNGVTIKNLKFSSPVSGTIFNIASGSGNIVVDGVEIYDHIYASLEEQAAGTRSTTTVSLSFGTSSPVGSITVKNCIINGSPDDNLVIGSSNGLIYNNDFSNPGTGSTETTATIGDCISCSLSGAHYINHLILNNRLSITRSSQKHCYLHNTSTGVGSGGVSTLIGNTFNLCPTSGLASAVAISVGQTDANANYIVNAYGNVINNANIALFAVNGTNTTGSFVGNLVKITKAVSSDSTAAVIQIAGTVEVSNNTIVNTLGASGNSFQAAIDMNKTGFATATLAYNNLIIGWSIGIRKKNTTSVEDYNRFSDVTVTVTNRDSDTPLTNGANDSALSSVSWDGGYQLDSGSGLIAAGTHRVYRTDASGTQFYNPPSIGAYEYVRPRQTATARQTRV